MLNRGQIYTCHLDSAVPGLGGLLESKLYLGEGEGGGPLILTDEENGNCCLTLYHIDNTSGKGWGRGGRGNKTYGD